MGKWLGVKRKYTVTAGGFSFTRRFFPFYFPKRRFYQGFGVRPGNKDRGVNGKIEAPEFLPAQNIRRTFPADPAVYQPKKTAGIRFRQGIKAPLDELFPAEAQGFGQEQNRVQTGTFNVV
jgi:hypothetical protein